MERITLTAEQVDADGKVTHRHTASIQEGLLKPEEIWAWLPDAFRTVGYRAMGDDLDQARDQ